jgi:hypothetical protein
VNRFGENPPSQDLFIRFMAEELRPEPEDGDQGSPPVGDAEDKVQSLREEVRFCDAEQQGFGGRNQG